MQIHENKFHFANLDALRAIAAFSVLLGHLFRYLPYEDSLTTRFICSVLTFNHLGSKFGVIFFFILSGFLITYLLLREKDIAGKIDIRAFYMRRVLRIWPLYYSSLIIGFFILPAILNANEIPTRTGSSLFLYSAFLANFDNLSVPADNLTLGVQWSVAVEEQFYLFWPLLFFIRIPSRFFPHMVGILFLGSEIFFFKQDAEASKYYHFFSCIRFLAWGGLLGYVSFYYEPQIREKLRKVNSPLWLMIYTSGLSVLFLSGFSPGNIWSDRLLSYLQHCTVFLFFGFVILEQNFSDHSLFKFGNFRLASRLGKISYGIYLLHMVVIAFLLLTPMSRPDLFAVNLVVVPVTTIILSSISFRYIEAPFLKLKHRYSRTDAQTHVILTDTGRHMCVQDKKKP